MVLIALDYLDYLFQKIFETGFSVKFSVNSVEIS